MLHGLYPKCFSPYLYLPFNQPWNWSDIYLLLLLRQVIRISNFITLLLQKPPNVLFAPPSCGLLPHEGQPRVSPDASTGWNGIIFLGAELTFPTVSARAQNQVQGLGGRRSGDLCCGYQSFARLRARRAPAENFNSLSARRNGSCVALIKSNNRDEIIGLTPAIAI